MSNYNLKTVKKSFSMTTIFRRHKSISFHIAAFYQIFQLKLFFLELLIIKKKKRNWQHLTLLRKQKKQRNYVKWWCHLVFRSLRRLKVFQQRFNVVSFRNSDLTSFDTYIRVPYRCVGNKYKLIVDLESIKSLETASPVVCPTVKYLLKQGIAIVCNLKYKAIIKKREKEGTLLTRQNTQDHGIKGRQWKLEKKKEDAKS